VFGPALPTAVRYWHWLAGAGIERGLIGPRESDRLWYRHLLNCAALCAFVPDGSVLVDIGSGAGLPGVVVALMRPDVQVICVDPMQRRITFLDEVVADLGLENVEVRRARAEDLARVRRGGSPPRVDVVTARAVGAVERLIGWAAPLLVKRGALVALKGSAAVEEVRSAWPAIRRYGFTGPTELFNVRIADAGSFAVERLASWQPESAGPSSDSTETMSVGGDVVHQGAPPLATVLRVLRTPERAASPPDFQGGTKP
jgi:16S rRNA (guanine527-N7)-methyltransferase